MPKLTHILVLALLVGCSSASGPAAAPDSSAPQRLDAALSRRDALAKEFAAIPAELRERCELVSGDCLIQLRERRGSLLEENQARVLACPFSNDLDQRLRCAAKVDPKDTPAGAAQPADPVPAFAAYYRDEGSCFKELLACTVKQKEDAVIAAHKAETKDRHRAILTGDAGVAARSKVAAIQEQIKYVRLTFPVQSKEICPPGNAFEPCLEQAQQKLADWEKLLGQVEGYDADAATAAYVESQQSEASCYGSELRCVLDKLTEFGVTAETQKMVQRNLDLISERQRLFSQLDDGTANQCLLEGRAQHQDDILNRYQDYVGQSKLYFRYQLDQAFISLHNTQINCLKSRLQQPRTRPGKSGKAGARVAGAR